MGYQGMAGIISVVQWKFRVVILGVDSQRFRNGQSTVGGPQWPKTDLFRPKWTILVHFGPANAKIQFGIRSF